MSLRVARGHVAIRAFVHSSSRSCGANAALYRQRERDRPPSAASESGHRDSASSSSAASSSSLPIEQLPPSAPYHARDLSLMPRTMIYGNYIHCLLPDKRSGRLVTYIFPRPSFTLKMHPLAVHPCVSGLGLDHGTLSPAQPIDNYKVVRDKREQQLAQAQESEDSDSWHCNVPPSRLREWSSHWLDVLFDGEPAEPPAKYLEEYAQPVTYVGINGRKAPSFARGRTSLLVTCLLSDCNLADPRYGLNELGLPSHITELLLSLPTGPLTKDEPELPTITRISPAQYVLTFQSRKDRNALFEAWNTYAARVARARDGCKPPYTIELDKQRAEAHDPAVDKAARTIAAKARQHGLDVQLDAMGGLWLGDTRYARVQDLPKLIFERTGMPRPTSSGSVASKLASAKRKPAALPPSKKPDQQQQPPSPLAEFHSHGRWPLRSRYSQELPKGRDATKWDMPPSFGDLIS
ncbi:hypothetical protein AURDEDRAFT_146901 [Auricularia subglabra TFB-10046 SS5]|uniref:Uncharacterized protein n=1 Tax=Auricularia subglabra (strain TFB-10046 / SS5) TaxID=717982 RepID=J0D0S7_AURST|nr:hypothetical protein AURDEDRAFT_146901 [Auricularia subglabra TFB-10046 SS5]